jgi:hypothetical protein
MIRSYGTGSVLETHSQQKDKYLIRCNGLKSIVTEWIVPTELDVF